jgi:hypothetical protein
LAITESEESVHRDIAKPDAAHSNSQEEVSKPISNQEDDGDLGVIVPSDVSPQSSPEPLVQPSVVPNTPRSWASMCLSEPIVRQSSVQLQQKDMAVKTVPSPATPSMDGDFPAMPVSPSVRQSVSTKLGNIDATMAHKSEWADAAAATATDVQPVLTPDAKKMETRAGNDNDLSSVVSSVHVHSKAENSGMLSLPSPPKISASSSMSNAKVLQSPPSSKPTAPILIEANVSPQPRISREVNHSQSSSSVVEQPLDNLFVMIRQQRQALFSGPLITLHINESVVTGVHKRVAMAVSRVLNEHFTAKPESTEYRFSTDILNPEAIRYLLISWMRGVSQEFEAYAVPMQDTFAKNVALLRAARFLGMEQYTRQILAEHVTYLKYELPSYEEIAIVERYATSPKDPLWTHMVNHLCHDRYKNLIPDPEVFAQFLEKHPRLEKAMQDADAYFAGVAKKTWLAKQAERQARQQAYEAEKRSRWEKYEAERQERIAREQQASESLK